MNPPQLKGSGFNLVQSRREERYIYYSTRPDMVSDLVRVLTACC